MPIEVDSPDDARLADFRDVRDGAVRTERGQFLVEGRRNVEVLARQRRFPSRAVLVTRTAFEAMRETWAQLPVSVPILVGLGIGELSGTPASVPVVKEIVRALDSSDVERDARTALGARTAAEVHAISAMRLRSAGLVEHPDIGEWLDQLLETALEPV